MKVGAASCGAFTAGKIDDFGGEAKKWLNIVSGIVPRAIMGGWGAPRAYYLDLNAGPGWYPDFHLDGSPVVFLRAAASRRLQIGASLFERDPATAQMLNERLRYHGLDANVIVGDHRETLLPETVRIAAETVGRRAYGLVFSDPNGDDWYVTEAGPSNVPSALLAEVAKRLPFFDFLLNVPATNIKRLRAAGLTDRTLVDDIKTIGKRFNLVRAPRGPSQWVMFLLTDWAGYPVWSKRGFSPVDSPEGRATIDRIAFTETERQPGLFA